MYVHEYSWPLLCTGSPWKSQGLSECECKWNVCFMSWCVILANRCLLCPQHSILWPAQALWRNQTQEQGASFCISSSSYKRSSHSKPNANTNPSRTKQKCFWCRCYSFELLLANAAAHEALSVCVTKSVCEVKLKCVSPLSGSQENYHPDGAPVCQHGWWHPRHTDWGVGRAFAPSGWQPGRWRRAGVGRLLCQRQGLHGPCLRPLL